MRRSPPAACGPPRGEDSACPQQDSFVDLVFEGGGVKGIGLAGALATLEERGYQPQNVAGTSAGAINASLLAAGYTRRGAARDHHQPRLPPVQGPRLGGQGAADRAVAQPPPRPRPLRGHALLRVDQGAARGEGRAHVRRPRHAAVRGRSPLSLQAAGDRVGRDDARAARAAAGRDEARDRAGRPRRRARGADEHEHPDLLRARALGEPEDRPRRM